LVEETGVPGKNDGPAHATDKRYHIMLYRAPLPPSPRHERDSNSQH
jgi:hypothetical protein